MLDEEADQAQRRFGILTLATLVCICATAALAFTAPSDLWLAAAFFFDGANRDLPDGRGLLPDQIISLVTVNLFVAIVFQTRYGLDLKGLLWLSLLFHLAFPAGNAGVRITSRPLGQA